MTRISWRAWLAAASIFLLGVAVGGTGAVFAGIHLLRERLQAPADGFGPADRAATRIGRDLAETLKLSSQEAERVQNLLDASAGRLKQIRAQAARDAAAELRTSTRLIADELPPEKRADYYRVIARRFHRLGLPAPVEAEAR